MQNLQVLLARPLFTLKLSYRVLKETKHEYCFDGTTCKTFRYYLQEPFSHSKLVIVSSKRQNMNIASMVLFVKHLGTTGKTPFHAQNQLSCPQRDKINISSMVLLARPLFTQGISYRVFKGRK
jgi:hypothetical protein